VGDRLAGCWVLDGDLVARAGSVLRGARLLLDGGHAKSLLVESRAAERRVYGTDWPAGQFFTAATISSGASSPM
jgi:hypothetical protein